jgi:ligand-binding SRPBCC domain-containing protein
VEVASTLSASPREVWEAASSMDGVNYELGPWLRMTAPPGLRIDPADVVPGERLFRSRLLLLGVLPVDYDDLTFVRVDEGRGFLERSPMLSARVWEHERVIEPSGAGCRVTDRVRFVPRVPFTAPVHRRVVAAVFHHRHRRLRRRFG